MPSPSSRVGNFFLRSKLGKCCTNGSNFAVRPTSIPVGLTNLSFEKGIALNVPRKNSRTIAVCGKILIPRFISTAHLIISMLSASFFIFTRITLTSAIPKPACMKNTKTPYYGVGQNYTLFQVAKIYLRVETFLFSVLFRVCLYLSNESLLLWFTRRSISSIFP